MRYIKTYEGFKTPEVEIIKDMENILLDLNDDGYYARVSPSNQRLDNLIAVTVSTYDFTMDYRDAIKSIKKFTYDNIKDVFYRLILYMMSEGHTFWIEYSDINSSWTRVDADVIINGIEGEHAYYRILFK